MAVYMVRARVFPGISNEQARGRAERRRCGLAEIDRRRHAGPLQFEPRSCLANRSACACSRRASADAVREVNQTAGLPFTRIVEALDLTPA